MARNGNLQTIYAELEAGVELAKCRKCGCMVETLDNLATVLPNVDTSAAELLTQNARTWRAQMEPIQYACLGCEHCFPAAAQNAFASAFPNVDLPGLGCEFQPNQEGWPVVVGEYFVIDGTAPVAVSTLASINLAEHLAHRKPEGLAIVGKTETENIGIDKIIKNVITNPAIQVLIVAGRDSVGHLTGKTLLALSENGVNVERRVIGSPGKRPVLRNVSVEEITAFQAQVQVIDMIGQENPEDICSQIEAFAQSKTASCDCRDCEGPTEPATISMVPTILVTEPGAATTLDKMGYFVIVPRPDKGLINVEHYDYNNTLLRIVQGTTARALYRMFIDNGWVIELSHAAYLGKELAKAELSLQYRFKYIQDGA